MLFKVRRSLGAALIVSVFIQMHAIECGYAAWKPKIVFSSTRDGDSEIYVMESDGSKQVRLTIDPARDYDPSWSPDGERIAFVSDRERGQEQIYVMDSDGGNPMRLTNDSTHQEPAWPPDGQRIAYDQSLGLWPSQIYVVESDGGGQPERLTDDLPTKSNPVWSPDGDTIAYVQEVPIRKTTIHLMTAEGQYLKQLSTVHGGDDTDPDWYAPVGWSVSPAANFVTIWGKIKTPASARR